MNKKIKNEENLPRLLTRNIGFLITGYSISGVGMAMAQFGLTFWIIAQYGTAIPMATAVAASTIGRLLSLPIASNMSASWNKKWTVIVTDIIVLALWAIASTLFIFGGMDRDQKFILIVTLIFLASIFGSFNYLASQTLLRLMTPKIILHKLYAVTGFLDMFRMMGVVALAGLTYALLGIEVIMIGAVVGLIVAIILELSLRFEEKIIKEKITKNPIKQYIGFVKNIKYLKKQDEVWKLFKLTIIMSLTSGAVWQVGNQYFLLETAGVSPENYSYIMAGGTLAGMLGPLIIYKLSKNGAMHFSRYVYAFIIVPTVIVMCLAIIGQDLANINELPGFFPALIVSNFVIIWMVAHFVMRPSGQITAISRHTAMNTTVDERDIGRLKGTSMFCMDLMALITVSLAGIIIDNFGIRYIYGFELVWAIIVGYLYFNNKTLKKGSHDYKVEKVKKLNELSKNKSSHNTIK